MEVFPLYPALPPETTTRPGPTTFTFELTKFEEPSEIPPVSVIRRLLALVFSMVTSSFSETDPLHVAASVVPVPLLPSVIVPEDPDCTMTLLGKVLAPWLNRLALLLPPVSPTKIGE